MEKKLKYYTLKNCLIMYNTGYYQIIHTYNYNYL
jgi:hypothetical protein